MSFHLLVRQFTHKICLTISWLSRCVYRGIFPCHRLPVRKPITHFGMKKGKRACGTEPCTHLSFCVQVRIYAYAGNDSVTSRHFFGSDNYYPSRRISLHFTVSGGNENILFESGRTNADGSIIGPDNDADQTTLTLKSFNKNQVPMMSPYPVPPPIPATLTWGWMRLSRTPRSPSR